MWILVGIGAALCVIGITGLVLCFTNRKWRPAAYVQKPVSVLEHEYYYYFEDDPAEAPRREQRDAAVLRLVISVVIFGIGISLLGFGLACNFNPLPV